MAKKTVTRKVSLDPFGFVRPRTDGHEWSLQQLLIFREFKIGTGHVVVVARAGTGKTNTIANALPYAPEARKLVAAFNKRIQLELVKNIDDPTAEAKTLHGVGKACVEMYWERLAIAKGRDRETALTEAVCPGNAPDPLKRLVSKLHSKGREIVPHARKMGDLSDLAVTFECEPDERWADSGFDAAWVERYALQAMELAATVKPVKTGIDFADMLYLPVRNQWLHKRYDMVVVDEAQDMTVTQLEIARGVCGGRIVIVGDDRQAIYAFRGADVNSLDRLKAELQATELSLTMTHRCGRAIVALAAKLVPDFQAAEHNPEGEIRTIGTSKLTTVARPGDFILSRTNAPLVTTAMALIRQQQRVKIAGKDIGAGLKDVMRQLNARSVPDFLGRLEAWAERETTRALKRKRDDKVEQIRDRADTLEVLCEGANSVREVEVRIDNLFTDDGLGDASFIVCSSVHRAKGLEADTVYVLSDTLYPNKRFAPKKPQSAAVQAARQREEENIEYVAITRAKRTLVWVTALADVAIADPKPAPVLAFTRCSEEEPCCASRNIQGGSFCSCMCHDRGR